MVWKVEEILLCIIQLSRLPRKAVEFLAPKVFKFQKNKRNTTHKPNLLFPIRDPSHTTIERSLPTNIPIILPITIYQQHPSKIDRVVGEKRRKYGTLICLEEDN